MFDAPRVVLSPTVASEAIGTTMVASVLPIGVATWPAGRGAPEDHATSLAGALLTLVTCSTAAAAPGGTRPATAARGCRERPARSRQGSVKPAPAPARVSRMTVGGTATTPGTSAPAATTWGWPAPGVALVDPLGQYGWVWATPVHQLVIPAAPSQDSDRCARARRVQAVLVLGPAAPRVVHPDHPAVPDDVHDPQASGHRVWRSVGSRGQQPGDERVGHLLLGGDAHGAHPVQGPAVEVLAGARGAGPWDVDRRWTIGGHQQFLQCRDPGARRRITHRLRFVEGRPIQGRGQCHRRTGDRGRRLSRHTNEGHDQGGRGRSNKRTHTCHTPPLDTCAPALDPN